MRHERIRPEAVDRAVKRQDTESLRAMGRKGAEVTNRIKDERRALDDLAQERQDEDFAKLRQETNEDIVPFDDSEGEDDAF